MGFVAASSNGGNVQALTAANSTPVAWPTVQSGDIALLFWTFGPSTTTVSSDPTGNTFTLVGTTTDGNDISRVLARTCTGSESGNITGWNLSAINRQSAVLYVVRDFSSVAAAVSFQETVTGTSHDCPQVTTGAGAADGDCIVIAGTDRAGSTGPTTAPSGFSKQTNSEFAATGSGGTLTVVADDGLTTGQTMPFDPGPFTGFTSSGTAVTWTLALRPSATNATVTPSAVAGTAGVPAPTVQAGAGVAASAVAATGSIPAAVLLAGSGVTPGAVAAVAAVPSPTLAAGSIYTAGTVTATAAIPAPSVSAGGSALVTPSSVAAVSSVPAQTMVTGSTVPAGTVTASASVPARTMSTGSTVAAVSVQVIAAVPSAVIQAGSRVTPTTVTGTAGVPAPTVRLGVDITRPSVVAVASVPAPALSVSIIAPTFTVTGRASIPAPTVITLVPFTPLADPVLSLRGNGASVGVRGNNSAVAVRPNQARVT